MRNAIFWFLILMVQFSSNALAAPKALVYNGAGACEEGCASAAFDSAAAAGFDPVYIGDANTDPRIFDGAAVWIQPGGHATQAMLAMSPQLKANLKNFIYHGGGYVGFCAGAFTATAKVGTTRTNGLGILPGRTVLYGSGVDLKKFTWNGSKRYLYWEGGPYFTSMPASVERISTYPNGALGAVRAAYGRGRVFVAGMHPEAPQSWKDYAGVEDPDGDDLDLVAQMIHWVTEAH